MSRSATTRGVWILAAIAVAVATIMVVTEIPRYRSAAFSDFVTVQTGAQCLIAGCDPYDATALNREIVQRHEPKVTIAQMAPSYPPSAFMVLMPFESFGWPRAPHLFELAAGLLNLVCAALLLWWFRIRAWDPGALILIALPIGDALWAAIHFGNPVLLEAGLACLACLLLLAPNRPRSRAVAWLAACSLGLALALKPQLAVGPTLILLARRNTRRAAIRACAVAFILQLVGIAAYRIRTGSFQYLETLRFDLALSVAPQGSSDFAPVLSFDFLNLQTSFATIPHISRLAINILAWLITAALAASAAFLAWKTHALERRPWTMIALAQIITLLPVYHRGYDRTIALILIPAAVEAARTRRWLAWLYAGGVAFWIVNEKLMNHFMTSLRMKPQNPVEELAFTLVLLASLWFAQRSVAERGLVAS